jgi:hypothetical protein
MRARFALGYSGRAGPTHDLLVEQGRVRRPPGPTIADFPGEERDAAIR